MVNTHRSWRRARWRRETPAEALPDGLSGDDIADRQALGALVRQALAGLPRNFPGSNTRPPRCRWEFFDCRNGNLDIGQRISQYL
jgi:hypothetical protein